MLIKNVFDAASKYPRLIPAVYNWINPFRLNGPENDAYVLRFSLAYLDQYFYRSMKFIPKN